MRILVVNDDGIHAAGIACLADLAKEFGEVWVVAPMNQCSAMSHKISVHGYMKIQEEKDFPVEGVHAYSVDGTPADCVKAACRVIMEEKPDIVFSGVNNGYNVGYDIAYSGTVGAAMDGLLHGIPAIAYSTKMKSDLANVKKYFSIVTKGILEQEMSLTEIWNVNFPGCQPEETQGILWDRFPAKTEYYLDHVQVDDNEEGKFFKYVNIEECIDETEGSDIHALNHNCISIGMIHSIVH
ncbi:MAG: 5'/3'-nucleotidase SurE [Eubacteriales bacterium]|nr:5'/3'-nucleotidase SurE [Eubacteriales bacterium]